MADQTNPPAKRGLPAMASIYFPHCFSNLRTISIIAFYVLRLEFTAMVRSFLDFFRPKTAAARMVTGRFMAAVAETCPAVRYRKGTAAEEREGGEECAVCLSEVEEGEEVRELHCRHVYHRGCLDRWLEVNDGAVCPLCRRAVLSEGALIKQWRSDKEYCRKEEMGLLFLAFHGGNLNSLLWS